MTRFVLALAVQFLPDDQWRRAMKAELAALDSGRWRFVLGCTRAVLLSGAFAGRIAGFALIAAALALVGWGYALIFAIVFLEGTGPMARKPAVVGAATVTGATAWWGALLLSETVRAHPQWALLVIALGTLAAARNGGVFAAAGTAFATCLAIFVVAVGTYSARPDLAPGVVPANARSPLLENKIESTDPYVGELLLAGLICLALMGAGVVASFRALPG